MTYWPSSKCMKMKSQWQFNGLTCMFTVIYPEQSNHVKKQHSKERVLVFLSHAVGNSMRN